MAQAIQYLTFGVDKERFALPVEQVQEILDLRAVSRIPHAPDYVVGLMDVRGVGMLLIDLRAKFGLARVEATNRTRVIVADTLIEGTEVARRPGRRSRVRSDRSRRRRVRAAAGDVCAGGRTISSASATTARGFVIVLDLEQLLGSDAPLIASAA